MKIVETIIAEDDTGRRYAIYVARAQISVNMLGGQHGTSTGAEDCQTSDGLYVNRIDENTFEIAKTNTVVRRI